MKTALQLVLICFSVLPPCLGFQTDPSKLFVQQFTDENGLPQNSITGLAFDNIGFVWISTQGGLVRFDGQKMVTFDKRRLSVDSDRFIELKRDALTGTLYGINDRDQTVEIKNGGAVRDFRYQYLNIAELDAITWPGEHKLTPRLKIDTSKTVFGYSKYRSVVGAQGRHFLYANQTVFFFNAGKLSGALPFSGKPCFEPFPGEPNMREKFIRQNKTLVCMDNFMSIGRDLFYHLNAEGPNFLKLSPGGKVSLSLKGDIERNPKYETDKQKIRIITNRQEMQAFAYLAGSIYYIIYNSATNILESRLLVTGFDLNENLVFRLMYDESNQALFLGSFSNGLRITRTKKFRVISNSQQKNFHNVFYAHLPYSKSSVIIPDGDILGDYNASKTDGLAFKTGGHTLRFGMLRDSAGNFWIAKSRRLYQLTSDGAKQKAMWELHANPLIIYEGIGGEIWIGFENGQIALLRAGATPIDKPQLVAKVNSTCTFLHQDKPGRIWIGSSRGLFLYDAAKKATYPVTGLSQMQIRSIHSTGVGQLWITTYGDGIFLVNNNKLYAMPLDRNAYLKHAHCILEDESQNFWISSNKGLFRTSKRDMIAYAEGKTDFVFYRYFNRGDGLLTNEFNGGCQPCGVKLADGHYSLPSMSGLVWFKPDQIPFPDLGAAMLFENLIVNEQSRKTTDTLRLSYDFSHVTFDVATPYMGWAENLDLRYAMYSDTPGHTRWSRINKEQKISVFNLKSGIYTLTVRKISGFGNRFVEKKLVLIVSKPWFLSWWFILLTLASLILIFRLLTRWRLISLRRQNTALSKKVEERTENLSRALQELTASDDALKTQLQIQMRIIGIINHDIHSPLRYLNKHVPLYTRQVGQQVANDEMVRMGEAISKSTRKVYGLVDDLLQFIKSTYNKTGDISYEQVNVTELLAKKAQFFSEIAGENQTTISALPGQPLVTETNRVMLEIMVHNLVDNSVKHTFEGQVTLSALQSGESGISIIVEDTGFGIAPDLVDWINSSHSGSTKESGPAIPMNVGLGLIMVKEIAALLGIELIVQSGPTGTRTEISLK